LGGSGGEGRNLDPYLFFFNILNFEP
jgi:hypothetical protein